MDTATGHAAALWPLAVYLAAAIAVAVSMIAFSYVLGQRHRERATGQPYESGIRPTGSARLRISAKFYLISMFFVIFDVEAAFIFAWAVTFRELGWTGYVVMLLFIGVMVAALVYLWRQEALDWGPRARRSRSPG